MKGRLSNLRLLLVDENGDFSGVLEGVGHEVARVREEHLERITELPDLVLGHVKIASCCDRLQLPWILLADAAEPEPTVKSKLLMAVLFKPFHKAELLATVNVAIQRFEDIRDVHRELAESRQALEDRKITERAKGIVMRMLAVEEDAAYRKMRCYASNKNRKLIDIAREIVVAEEPFRALRDDPVRA